MVETQINKENSPVSRKPQRGLILSPPFKIKGKAFIGTGGLDIQELKASTLFFDKLLWPSSRALSFYGGPDAEFLEKEGILLRPDYTFNGDVNAGVLRGYIKAFQDMNEKEPGAWAMAHIENSYPLIGSELTTETGTTIQLYRALPVPDKEVPLDEILEFKRKRYDELSHLRVHLDGLAADIENAEDRNAELSAQIKSIDEACGNVLRVCHEWQFPVRLSSLKASIEFRPLVTLTGAIAGYTAPPILGLPITSQIISGILGAASVTAPALKIAADLGWRGLKRPTTPFRYVSSYHREMF